MFTHFDKIVMYVIYDARFFIRMLILLMIIIFMRIVCLCEHVILRLFRISTIQGATVPSYCK